MSTQGPNNLTAAIGAAASKIRRYADRRLGEQNTKAALIEPVLEALGWDIRDPDEVHQEFRPVSRDNPVDYALKLMRQPRLFVEAKGLGEDLSDRKWIAQVLGYATVAGVEWCLLTDGNEYRFYNATAPVDADEKLFCRVKLSSDSVPDAVTVLSLITRDNLQENHLERLWREHFIDRRVKKALEEMLEAPDPGLVRSLRRRVTALRARDIIESLHRLEFKIASPPPVIATAPAKAIRGKGSKQVAGDQSLVRLIAAGTLRAPLRLFHRYKGKNLEATLHPDGSIEFDSVRYSSCSTAADVARATVTGRRMSTNGWDFWCYEGAAGKPTPLQIARRDIVAPRRPGRK